MKILYKILVTILVVSVLAGCTKYGSDVNLEEAAARQENLTEKVKQRLADAPNGWLLLVPNVDTSIQSALPVLMKFDTAKGVFTSKSPFPASASTVPSIFELSSATGAPLLSFATGSIFSGWYEAGGITDYYFKVLNAGTDTIIMQPYRKGTIYAPEGGIVMKMIRQKVPLTWFDNLYDLPAILTANTAPFWNNAVNPLKLTNVNGYIHPAQNMEFDKHSAGNLSFIQTRVAFSRYLNLFPVFLYLNNDYVNPLIYYCGNNTLIAHVDNGFSPAAWFITGPQNFSRAIKTDYMLVRNVNTARTKIDVFAVDQNGKEIITGSLETK